MTMTRLMGAAAVAALLAGAAQAQTPPSETTPPTAPPPTATPPAVTPPTPAAQAAKATPSVVAPVPSATPATPAAPATLVAKGDVIDTLKADGRFKTLVKALEATNMTTVLKNNRNLTVFAPTDAAFAALPPGELDRLMKDPPALQKLLTYHVVNATVDSAKMKGARGGVKTVAGSEVVLDGSGEGLKVNTATIVQSDVRPTNGTIHVVDKVLTPQTAPSMAATTGATTDAAATAPAPATTTPPVATPPKAGTPPAGTTPPGDPDSQPDPADPEAKPKA